ncbi:MAG: RDD family protein [Candidatus Thorarchaeota archaeon]
MELDFDEPSADDSAFAAEDTPGAPSSRGPGVDAELGGSTDARAWHPGSDALEGAEIGGREDPPQSSDFESGDVQPGSGIEPQRAQMVFDSVPEREEPEVAPAPLDLHLAPLSRRLWGGIIDALVLVVAAGVFALIFWRAGGRMSPHALNLIAVGFIAVFLVFAYFSVFTALTSTTPGLLWMGIEVQSFRGGAPTPHQAIWRAFGYLVSTSALMLGFIWALVDSDGLTWHDRMSDTFLTPSDGGM